MKMSNSSPRGLARRAHTSLTQLMEGLEPRQLLDGVPTIGSVQAPVDPVVPGTRLNIVFNDVVADMGTVDTVAIYRDENGNGIRDLDDELFGTADQDPNDPERWIYSELLPDNVGIGDVMFLGIASGNSGESVPTPIGVNLQFRLFYPEGWRNDSTINEYVPMVNPNNFPVDFRIIARYETGERDAVISEGTIPANSRGGITVSEYVNPGQSLVRLNEGFAIEIQASDYIGAMLSHYDSFTGNRSTGAAVGESFGNQTSHEWFFSDISNASADFILFYNPFDQALPLQVTFYDEQGNETTVDWNVEPFRRSGLAMSNTALGLPANQHFGVFIRSTSGQQFVAAASSYSFTSEIGYTNLAQRLGVAVYPAVEFRESTDNDLILFNPADSAIDVIVRSSYIGTDDAPTEITYSLAPNERRVVDLDDERPEDATAVSLRVQGGYIQLISVDETRGDSLQETGASVSATRWTFGDGFLDRNTAGTVGFETLGIYNPSNQSQLVTVRFIFTDGTFTQRNINVDSRSGATLQLDQENLILDHDQLNFYSIEVTSQAPVVANMIHWDLFQGGGWASIGTPGGLQFTP